jgi:16S rRNA (guanine527-N7)-methyltransferase
MTGRQVTPPPPVAEAVFGDRLADLTRFADLLATTGVERGLVGPREVPRLWQRHLVNCALIAPAFAAGCRVVDVGSGAGLPGLVLALTRPDLRVDLVESLARRVDFLTQTVAEFELGDRVRVLHGRAESPDTLTLAGGADAVTARAVAPLDRLVGWCLPLLRSGGLLVALKGAGVEAELESAAAAIRRLGGSSPEVVQFRLPDWPDETTAVVLTRVAAGRVARAERTS